MRVGRREERDGDGGRGGLDGHGGDLVRHGYGHDSTKNTRWET